MNALAIAGMNDIAALEDLRHLFEDTSPSDLSEGIAQSYPIVSFKGKVWRVKHKGEERAVKDPTTGDPVASILAVVVKASSRISKLFYDKRYQEGDDAAPDCFSLDGLFPDPSVQKPPHTACATCPKNAWGSRVNESGQKLKACSDHKRIAIVPYPDLDNQGNGPMLLRIPPASLQNLATLGTQLQSMKIPYQAVVVKISFDHELAYPKLTFTPVRALTREEATVVRRQMESLEVERMLSQPSQDERRDVGGTEPAAQVATRATTPPAAQAPVETKVEVTVKTEAAPDPKPTSKQTAMDEGETVSGPEADELDAMLTDILNG